MVMRFVVRNKLKIWLVKLYLLELAFFFLLHMLCVLRDLGSEFGYSKD
jgi:hypothetical protein